MVDNVIAIAIYINFIASIICALNFEFKFWPIVLYQELRSNVNTIGALIPTILFCIIFLPSIIFNCVLIVLRYIFNIIIEGWMKMFTNKEYKNE